MRLAPISSLALLLGLFGCGGGKPVTATALAAAPLASVEIHPERSPLERQLDGTIEAVNQGTVAAQTSGRVAEILYDVNDFVPAGAVIVRLRATEQRTGLLQAEASLREAQARAIEAQTQFERVSEIYARKLVPKATFDEATAARDAANARLTAAQAAVQAAREGVSYTEIRAPYAGIVTRRHVELGETVHPGTLLMSGLSLQYLRVAVDVPQSIVEQVRRIRKAAVYVGERRIEAQKLTVFPEATAPSNTFRARIELPENAADLYPGMFVKVGFVVGEADRLLVPAGALVQRGEVNAVYLIATDGSTTLRQVRVGHRFGERVEILAGLVAGDRVALDPVAASRRLEPAS